MHPTITDRTTFLAQLRQSGLLSGTQLRDVACQFPHVDSAAELSRALVRQGTLTRFQARMLLNGRCGGFFLGPYRILELLGHGGMGRVYKALHVAMNRTVALKVLSPNLVKTARARALFRQEVQTAAQLNHPNIVHAYDAAAINGRHFLAMEYIHGATLSHVVKQRGRLPVGIACEVIRQAALGLAHAHEMGLVHRDIKPANLMMSIVRPTSVVNAASATGPAGPLDSPHGVEAARLQVKILDFGLAQLQRRRPRPEEDSEGGRNPITGTPDFMSPEQARNRDLVDIRSDLYSLGCTFYYLLTGQVPFPGGGMLDKLIRHHSEIPTAPEKLRPNLPPPVAAIVMKLLAKDPADRFQTPGELAQALAPHASVPVLDRPPQPQDAAALPAEEPLAQAAEKTVGPGHHDTSPHIELPPAITSEREALSSWVEIRLDQRRRERLYWLAGAFTGVAAAAATAVFTWMQLR
jgi:serine/threonine-protein kinase